MSEAIELSYRWDRETYHKAAKAAYDYELKSSNKRFIGWFFIALTQFGVVAAMKKGAIGLLLVSTLLVLYWYFLRWPLRKVMIEKAFDTLSNKNHNFIIQVREEGISINEHFFPWQEILLVVSASEGYLLYTKKEFFFFPTKAFMDMEHKNEFSKFVKARAVSYKRI